MGFFSPGEIWSHCLQAKELLVDARHAEGVPQRFCTEEKKL
jgi:hypothetical protein